MTNKKPIYVEPKNYFGPTQKPKTTTKKTVKKSKKCK
jgi:hypothetical protein